MKNLLLFLLFIMGAFYAWSQEVSAVADKDSILIGEQIKLELKASFKKDQPPAWFEYDSFPRFEILSSSVVDTQESGSGMVLSQSLVLTSWDSGSWKIPSFYLGRKSTDPISIEVSFTEMDPNKEYNDVKDILPVARPRESKWYWYLIMAVALIGLFLLFFPASKKNEEKKIVIPENAYRDAIQKLERLEENREADHKLFYTELVHIFREYLHRKKNIQSFSKTTDDLSVQVKSLHLSQGQYDELVHCLQQTDMVKFAKYQPLPGEKEQAMKTIRQSIDTIENLPNAV